MSRTEDEELRDFRKAIWQHMGQLLENNMTMSSPIFALLGSREVEDLKRFRERSQTMETTFEVTISEMVTIQRIHLIHGLPGNRVLTEAQEVLFSALSKHYSKQLKDEGETHVSDRLYADRYQNGVSDGDRGLIL